MPSAEFLFIVFIVCQFSFSYKCLKPVLFYFPDLVTPAQCNIRIQTVADQSNFFLYVSIFI